MCDQCGDDLDALLESLHEHHDVDERVDVLRKLHTRLREAILQAREDAGEEDEAASRDEDDDAELFDEDEEEDE